MYLIRYEFTRDVVPSRAGLRHVRGVRPNRAADLGEPPFWTLKRTKNAETRSVLRASIQCSKMRLQPGHRLGPRWENLQRSPRPRTLRDGEGKGKRRNGKGGEGKGKEEEGQGGEKDRTADWLRSALVPNNAPIKSSSPSKTESSSSSDVRSESGVLSDSLSTDVEDQTLPTSPSRVRRLAAVVLRPTRRSLPASLVVVPSLV